jgi:hypothetical protein
MFDACEQTPEFRLIEMIAGTIRSELGDEVEVCPGLHTPEEAEPLNRVFRALVRRILEPLAAPGQDFPSLVTWALRQLVVRRLAAGGLNATQIRILLDLEPGVPDDWLTFLLLVPWAEVLYWLRSAGQEPE